MQGSIWWTQKETHECTNSPTSKLGATIWINVWCIWFCVRSSSITKSQEDSSCDCLCIQDPWCNPNELHNNRERVASYHLFLGQVHALFVGIKNNHTHKPLCTKFFDKESWFKTQTHEMVVVDIRVWHGNQR